MKDYLVTEITKQKTQIDQVFAKKEVTPTAETKPTEEKPKRKPRTPKTEK